MSLPNQPHDRKPVVLLVANLTWAIAHYRESLVRSLQHAGYRVVVVAPSDESVQPLQQKTKVEHQPLRFFSRNSTNPFRCILMLVEFFFLYLKLKPALVIHFGIQANVFGNIAARICGKRSICVVTGLGYTFLHHNLVSKIVRALYKFSFRLAERVILENPDDQRILVDAGIVELRKTAAVSGCGIDPVEYSPRERPENANLVFTYIGRLLFDKGLEEFVYAAENVKKHHPNAKFQLLGPIDTSNPAHVPNDVLTGWVRSGAVNYLGCVSDVRPYIAGSDWVVLPSYREGLSRTLLEAMCMERPIVVTDVPGCRQTVEHGENGFLVPAKNAAALSTVLEKCCTTPAEIRRKMGQYGRSKACREFSVQQVDTQYLDLISQLVSNPQQPVPATVLPFQQCKLAKAI